MVIIKRLAAVLIILNIAVMTAYGQITVPNYSFTGQEITNFKVRPSYTAIQFNFSMPSQMDIYLQVRKQELAGGDKRDYTSEEPGFIYKDPNSARFTSLFVGAKALRNNVVKSFLNKDYIDTVSSYERFEKKLVKSDFDSETKFLYGMSLFYTGSQQEAIDILLSLLDKKDEYSLLAQDALFLISSELRKYNIMEDAVARNIDFTDFSLSKWIEYLYSKDRYEDILQSLNNHPAMEETYPVYKNMRIICYYFLKQYKQVEKAASNIEDESIIPVIADSYIMSSNTAKAKEYIKKLPKNDVYYLLNAKIDVAENRLKAAEEKIMQIKSDNEKLSLLFYAVGEKFTAITPEFLQSFKFKERATNDYVYFYTGIKYFEKKDYANSMLFFSLIGFNKSLLNASYFYQGMASLYVDMNRAEYNFQRFISSGLDYEKLTLAKFMLAQIYYLKEKYDDALMLVDDCNTSYCHILKGDLYLALNDEEKAFSYVKDKTDDRSRLIKANVYYNSKKYKSALDEVLKIKKPSPDSKFLLMMCYFKEKRPLEAEKIMRENRSDIRIFSSGVQQLILAGQGKKALDYMEGLKNLTPDFKLERAKLLAAYNRLQDAKKDYNELIISGDYIYESITGLFEIAKKEKKGKEFVDDKLNFIEKSAEFENKDLIISEFASYALDVKSTNTSIGYVNFFMDNYPQSQYYPHVLETRAKLFKFTGRYDNCVTDADKIIAKGGTAAEDALFMKAECLEYIDKNKAMDVYKEVAEKSDRFSKPAYSRVAGMSNMAEDVIWAAEKLKITSPKMWENGILRFIDLSNKKEYEKHMDYIVELSKTSTPAVRSASLWRIGKDQFESGKTADASVTFMKGYYLFPEEKYALENLIGAKASYTKRKKEKELSVVEKILKEYSIKNEKSQANQKVNISRK